MESIVHSISEAKREYPSCMVFGSFDTYKIAIGVDAVTLRHHGYVASRIYGTDVVILTCDEYRKFIPWTAKNKVKVKLIKI